MLKSSRRWLGVAVPVAAAAAAISFGAGTMAPSASARPAGHAIWASTTGTHSNRPLGAPVHKSVMPQVTTAHVSLAASAFAPDSLRGATNDYFNQWDPSTLSNTDTNRCFNTALALPSDAKLKSVTFYYTAGSASMYYQINQQSLPTHTYKLLASGETVIASTPTYTSSTLNLPGGGLLISYAKFAYSIGVCPSGTTTFTGITLAYTPAS